MVIFYKYSLWKMYKNKNKVVYYFFDIEIDEYVCIYIQQLFIKCICYYFVDGE